MRLSELRRTVSRLLARPASARTAAQSRHIEILITRPGHPAHSLRIDLQTLRRFMLMLGTGALLWLTFTVYSAWSQWSSLDAQRQAQRLAASAAQAQQANARLQAENSAMTRTLLALKARVDALANTLRGVAKERAQQFPLEQPHDEPRGGLAEPLTLAQAAALQGEEAARLAQRLDALLPQARRLAAREAARPMGEPVDGDPRITSEYGLRPNPFGAGVEFHNGMDFQVPIGTPVRATADGVVASAERRAGYGLCVVIDHAFGYSSLFGHLSKVLVQPGQKVKRGEVIALSGNSGRSTGPHLHYSLFYGEKTVDPEPYVEIRR